LKSVVYIQAGGYHNGAIDTNGFVYMWGRGDVGQLAISNNSQEL
jgi:alpha-tubulin suppressor-like RCC1 family protein